MNNTEGANKKMKAEILTRNFNSMVNSVKRFAAKQGTRPIHQWIRLEVSEEQVTAIAIDGYKMGVANVPCVSCGDPFIAYIRPDIRKVPEKAYAYVSLELTDGVLLVSYGDNITGYKQPKDDFIDWKKAYNDLCEKEVTYTICINPDHMIAALQSAKATPRASVKLRFRKPNEPVILSFGNEDFGLVMPMRTRDEC